MPALDQLFARADAPAFAGAQCWEAIVVATGSDGPTVVLPGYDRQLRWGPCMPADAAVGVGERVSVAMSEEGVPWLLGAGGGGGSGGSGGNIDGGFPDSIYGGVPITDGGGV